MSCLLGWLPADSIGRARGIGVWIEVDLGYIHTLFIKNV